MIRGTASLGDLIIRPPRVPAQADGPYACALLMLLEMCFVSQDVLLLVIHTSHVAMRAAMIVAREGRTVEVSPVHSDAGIEWLATRRASDPQHEASHE